PADARPAAWSPRDDRAGEDLRVPRRGPADPGRRAGRRRARHPRRGRRTALPAAGRDLLGGDDRAAAGAPAYRAAAAPRRGRALRVRPARRPARGRLRAPGARLWEAARGRGRRACLTPLGRLRTRFSSDPYRNSTLASFSIAVAAQRASPGGFETGGR